MTNFDENHTIRFGVHEVNENEWMPLLELAGPSLPHPVTFTCDHGFATEQLASQFVMWLAELISHPRKVRTIDECNA